MPHIDWTIEASPYRIKFLIQAVYYLLPSPSKCFCLGRLDSPACHLCLGRGTLEHIFSCCPKALGEGCCLWCHQQVLKAIANTICSGIHLIPSTSAQRRRALPSSGLHRSLLQQTGRPLLDYWQRHKTLSLKVDLGNQLKFWGTTDIAPRPDMLLISEISNTSSSQNSPFPGKTA